MKYERLAQSRLYLYFVNLIIFMNIAIGCILVWDKSSLIMGICSIFIGFSLIIIKYQRHEFIKNHNRFLDELEEAAAKHNGRMKNAKID